MDVYLAPTREVVDKDNDELPPHAAPSPPVICTMQRSISFNYPLYLRYLCPQMHAAPTSTSLHPCYRTKSPLHDPRRASRLFTRCTPSAETAWMGMCLLHRAAISGAARELLAALHGEW